MLIPVDGRLSTLTGRSALQEPDVQQDQLAKFAY